MFRQTLKTISITNYKTKSNFFFLCGGFGGRIYYHCMYQITYSCSVTVDTLTRLEGTHAQTLQFEIHLEVVGSGSSTVFGARSSELTKNNKLNH